MESIVLQAGDEVRVYWNSRKRVFSVQVRDTQNRWVVAGYTNSLVLTDVTFTVSKAGLARARREGVKNVHAYVRGVVPADDLFTRWGVDNCVSTVYYSYGVGSFHTRAGVHIDDAQYAVLSVEDARPVIRVAPVTEVAEV
jgi:hypothetical protein